MSSCGEAVVAALAARGVDTVFGIPGVHTLELYRGLASAGIRHVGPRHEQGAAFMADGYGRAGGRPGVCVLISGPGVTNALTPLAQARHDARPLLIVSACTRSDQRGRGLGVIHDLPDQAAVTRAVTRLTVSVDDPAQLQPALDAAWAVLDGSADVPGPVHVQIPVDVLSAPAAPAAAAAVPARRPVPDGAAIERAAALLARARRPAILLGGGARDAGAAAVRLAERLAAPVGLTINGKGAVDPRHPLCVPSRMMFAPVHGLFVDADVVVAAGTQLSDLDWWALDGYRGSGQVVRIDVDPASLDANAPAAVAVLGDAAAALGAIADAVPQAPEERRGVVEGEVADALRHIEWPAEVAEHLPLVRALDRALPRDRIVAADSTQPGYAANHALDVEAPGSWLMPIGYGTLGCALPMAIGARLAAPDRPVLALAGDGGALFTIQELATARDLGLPLPFVVWNNAGYGEIRDAMRGTGIAPLGTEASASSFPTIAEGFGCRGVRAESLEHVQELVVAALAAPVPTLIEVTPQTRGVAGDGR